MTQQGSSNGKSVWGAVLRGDPANSGIVYESHITLFKPRVDVLLLAHAYAPGGRPTKRFPVHLSLGNISKTLVVSGDREWLAGDPTRSLEFDRLPLIYERA